MSVGFIIGKNKHSKPLQTSKTLPTSLFREAYGAEEGRLTEPRE